MFSKELKKELFKDISALKVHIVLVGIVRGKNSPGVLSRCNYLKTVLTN